MALSAVAGLLLGACVLCAHASASSSSSSSSSSKHNAAAGGPGAGAAAQRVNPFSGLPVPQRPTRSLKQAFKRSTEYDASVPVGTELSSVPFMPGACGDAPTSLGYQCSWRSPQGDGVVLHWSFRTATPPSNRCTRRGLPSKELDGAWAGDPAVHFALEAPTHKKLHLTFLDGAGRYFPSEGVHARAPAQQQQQQQLLQAAAGSSSSGGPLLPAVVEVLHYDAPGTFYTSADADSRQGGRMRGWAAFAAADHDGATHVACVSRKLRSRLMSAGGDQQGTVLPLAYAVSDAADYVDGADALGMLLLDVASGGVVRVQPPMRLLALHGVLMVLAFGVLLPAGLLMARHKWLFIVPEEEEEEEPDENGIVVVKNGGGGGTTSIGATTAPGAGGSGSSGSGGSGASTRGVLSPWWALAHMTLLVLGAATGLIGMIVVLVRLGNAESSLLLSSHQVLGLIAIGLSVLLVGLLGIRPFLTPAPGHRHSSSQLLAPIHTASWLTLSASWAALMLGCVAIHGSWAAPLALWLAPTVCVCGVTAAAACLLEVRFQQLIRTGEFNPKLFGLPGGNGGNGGGGGGFATRLPCARIRAGWERFTSGGGGGGAQAAGGSTQTWVQKKVLLAAVSKKLKADVSLAGVAEEDHQAPGSPGIAAHRGGGGTGHHHHLGAIVVSGATGRVSAPGSNGGGSSGSGSGGGGSGGASLAMGSGELTLRRGRTSAPNAPAPTRLSGAGHQHPATSDQL